MFVLCVVHKTENLCIDSDETDCSGCFVFFCFFPRTGEVVSPSDVCFFEKAAHVEGSAVGNVIGTD